MNAVQQHHPTGLSCNDGGVASVNARQAHLTKFAFLLSSARSEGIGEPVVGMHHDVEMAACFSKRHLQSGGGMSVMSITPPSISSNSLSMKGKIGQNNMDSLPDKEAGLLEMAAMNMSMPFYTTPDTVSSTAKTLLKNIGESILAAHIAKGPITCLQSFIFRTKSLHDGRSHRFKITLCGISSRSQDGATYPTPLSTTKSQAESY